MNSFEMVYSFQMKLETISDKFIVEEKPDTDTVLSYLNLGQIEYFNAKYLNKGSFKENTEFLQGLANDELIYLIQSTGPVTISAATLPGHTQVYIYTPAIPQYAHYIESYCYMSRTQPKTVTTEWVINRPANSIEDLGKIETNWYNKPILRNPIVFPDSTASLTATTNFKLYLVADSYTVLQPTSNFHMRYIRRPKAIVLNVTNTSNETTTCELAEYLHEDIVTAALNKFKSDKFTLIAK